MFSIGKVVSPNKKLIKTIEIELPFYVIEESLYENHKNLYYHGERGICL